MPKLEFFFDCTSPWTYLAFTGIQPIVKRNPVDMHWRPILVGGVFNAVNQGVYEARESMFNNERRVTHYMKDLQDWADYYDLTIRWPDMHPANAVKIMRGCFVAQEAGKLIPYAKQCFESYWRDGKDVSQDDVINDIVTSAGLDTSDFFNKINQQAYKDRLRDNTEELIARGGYGSPTLFVDETDMYFGNDRLLLVDHRLQQTQ
ncbi:2-hydroxychromene-2-carboxylate isomerase [Litorivivens sp.]|uniref:2-hydroxychromene-2-carboxylate isomerase n=1 Tax=Litorivivens sp. TaxID=2020868 RepID=UPI00356AE270